MIGQNFSEAAAGQRGFTDDTSFFNAIQFIVSVMAGGWATATIVEVQSVMPADDGGGRVSVKPMVNQIDSQGTSTPHGTIFDLPYIRLQGGVSAVIMDPVVGDIGLAVFASRDISAVKNTQAVSNPGSFRRFDYADGIYVGGLLNGTPTQLVKFSDAGIEVASPTQISLSAAGHSVVINDTGVIIDGKVFLTHEHSGVQTGGGNSGPVA